MTNKYELLNSYLINVEEHIENAMYDFFESKGLVEPRYLHGDGDFNEMCRHYGYIPCEIAAIIKKSDVDFTDSDIWHDTYYTSLPKKYRFSCDREFVEATSAYDITEIFEYIDEDTYAEAFKEFFKTRTLDADTLAFVLSDFGYITDAESNLTAKEREIIVKEFDLAGDWATQFRELILNKR